MNFARDVLERLPPEGRALVELTRDGARREWTFGEVARRSARLAGRPERARRAPGRCGDDADRQPPGVGADDARLLSHRRGGAAVHRAAAREGPAPAAGRRAAAAGGGRRAQRRRARGRPATTCDVALVPDESLFAIRARPRRGARRRRPVPDHFHQRHLGRAQGGAARPALPRGPAPAGRGTGWAREPGELVWCTAASGLVEVGAQRVHRAVAVGSRGAAARRALRSRGAPGAAGARAGERAVHGAHRVPRDRQARDPAPAPRPARDGGGRRGAEPGGAARLARGHRAWHPRRVRADRDRPADRDAGRPGAAARARWGGRCRAWRWRSIDGELTADPGSVPTFFLGYLGEEVRRGEATGSGGRAGPWRVADRRAGATWRTGDRVRRGRATAICTSRVAPTT